MAVTLESKHNVYVSFRHSGDPAAPGGVEWTDRVVAHLLIALRERVGRMVNVRLDRQATLSNAARELLEQRILQSALFVTVLSPGYLGEKRTQWEMETALSPKSLVRASLIVEALPIGEEEGASRLEGIPTLKFWDADKAGEPVAVTDFNRELFTTRVGQLADVIAGALAVVEQRARDDSPDQGDSEDEQDLSLDELLQMRQEADAHPIGLAPRPAQPAAIRREMPARPVEKMPEPTVADTDPVAREEVETQEIQEKRDEDDVPPPPLADWQEPEFFTDFFAEVAAEYGHPPAPEEGEPEKHAATVPAPPRREVPLPEPRHPPATLGTGPKLPLEEPKPPRPRRPRPPSTRAGTGQQTRWIAVGIGIGLTAGLAAAAVWMYRQELLNAAGGLLDLLHSAVAPAAGVGSAARMSGGRDIVDVSAFAPSPLKPGQQVPVQVLLHVPDDTEAAVAQAIDEDAQSGLRGIVTLATGIARGDTVAVALDAGPHAVTDQVQKIVWRGQPHVCQFLVTLPADEPSGPCPMVVRLFIDEVPVGTLRFVLRVTHRDAPRASRTAMRGQKARRYARAFLSYSPEDRPAVLKRAQALRAARIGFFQELLALEPSERWHNRLKDEIDRSDVFMLFWSKAAAESEWVRREAEYALERRSATMSRGLPDIVPVLLEDPPVPEAPESLREIGLDEPIPALVRGTIGIGAPKG